ncbi:ubiquinone biosynthesis protein COQ9 [Yamadazyma tenuis ATCC 10573]|uniref:Ubiquinone biosynthesis protein n=2 Tax=Candida tenuis TaxID=2315449 RepID=G3BB99_CANTC|nr:ubiquinone biosynthesis protein COQ9 [Yamadazyma tenuis ATCC 10573]EGV61527.1 ubiquinone biosynthesis protein COQ9 [Yamadazyma tenuis ATCC 10573]
MSNRFWSRGLQSVRRYHAYDHPASNLIVDPTKLENKLLTKSLEYIPQFGFSDQCISEAIKQMQYPDSIRSILTASFSGHSTELQLMVHWLKTQRQALDSEVNSPDSQLHSITDEYERASFLINKRLSYNIPIIDKLSGGISQLLVPYNMSFSLEELYNLGDDIAFHAGDASIDFAWYAKRLSLSMVYVSSELYMVQDKSADFVNTKKFVEDKVKNIDHLGEAYENIEQWAFFNAISAFNLVKSQVSRG